MQLTVTTSVSPIHRFRDIAVLVNGQPLWRDRHPDVIEIQKTGLHRVVASYAASARTASVAMFELHNEMNHASGSWRRK